MLFLITAAHGLAETARDTLFLQGLAPERLPWAYLGIATGVLLSAQALERAIGAGSRLRALRLLLALGALGHLGFATIQTPAPPASLYALYVWCGVLTTQLLIQLWLAVAGAVDVGLAKRAFAWISAAGLAGAAGGAGLAALLLLRVPVQGLLVASALVLTLAAVGSLWLPASARGAAARVEASSWRDALADAYGKRVLLATGLLAAATVGVDYLFKAAAVAALPAAQLGDFFARFHAAANGGALAAQLAITPWLFQRIGVARSLLALPALLATGSGLVAALGGFWPALALKASETVLAQSVHRAGNEILFLPVPEPLRIGLRSAAAALGQRGGQALGSLALLAALAVGARAPAVAVGTAAFAAAVFAVVVGLRARYADRFRAELRSLGAGATGEIPRLDLAALECLIAALSSPDPDDVLAALDLLERYGRARLVPPLVLYHPDPRVLVRALQLFRDGDAAAPDGLVRRLGEHPDADVRAAALRCRGDAFDASALRKLLYGDDAQAVRAAALAELSRRGALDPKRGRELMDGLLGDSEHNPPDVARAIATLDPAQVGDWLVELAGAPDPAVRLAVAEELARNPAPPHVPALLDLLADPDAREPARRALCAVGVPALDALAAALRDPGRRAAVRRHLPRSISRFAAELATPLLVQALGDEPDPNVRHKVLRGLGRLRADRPDVPVDAGRVLAFADTMLRRALDLVAFRTVLESAPSHDELLLRLLQEEEGRALERVFRALHIIDPEIGYQSLCAALQGDDARAAAAAREVLEHVVKEPLRAGLLALVAPDPTRARLRAALAFHAPAVVTTLGDAPDARDLGPLWAALAADADPVLAAVAGDARARFEEHVHGER